MRSLKIPQSIRFEAATDKCVLRNKRNYFSRRVFKFAIQPQNEFDGVDIVAWGVPHDLSVTNMPGCRLGPRGIRAASSNVAWDGGPWYWEFDPFEKLLMVD